MLILGIETTVDDTGVALVKDGWDVVSSIVSSQNIMHEKYGGIVPEISSRMHAENILPVLEEALFQGKTKLSDIRCIAISATPGLVGSLLIGINCAKTLSLVLNKPLVAINDLESHAYSVCLEDVSAYNDFNDPSSWPKIYLIVSGGTTQLIYAKGIGDYHTVGDTLDDSAGETLDKVARLMGYQFPGGPAIEKASQGISPTITLPKPMHKDGTANFSFSGLKTSVVNKIRGAGELDTEKRCLFASSLQATVIEILIEKLKSACQKYKPKAVVLGGGVAANTLLRQRVVQDMNVKVYIPQKKYCTDNASMTAGCAHRYFEHGVFSTIAEVAPFKFKDINGVTCATD
ncbi:MAG: tRNA (adenosine(37)-N6)-threonylcarbamoyltransferase complex transferase subunit TsaD [Patescibacteria group bacterium]